MRIAAKKKVHKFYARCKTRYEQASFAKRYNFAADRNNTKVYELYVYLYRMIRVYMTGIQVIGYTVAITEQEQLAGGSKRQKKTRETRNVVY